MGLLYKLDIENNRCLLQAKAFITIEESGNLSFKFNGIREGAQCVLSLCDKKGLIGKFTLNKEGSCEVQRSRLRVGIMSVELFEVGGAKYVARPIEVKSILQNASGLCAYPELDEILARLSEQEKKEEQLKQNFCFLLEVTQKQQEQIDALIIALNNPIGV